MSYVKGIVHYENLIDRSTPFSDLTQSEMTEMVETIADWLCDLFGMVVFDSWTDVTTRGNRLYIGYENTYPIFAIGWKTSIPVIAMAMVFPETKITVQNNYFSDTQDRDYSTHIINYSDTYMYCATYVKDTTFIGLTKTVSNNVNPGSVFIFNVLRTDDNRKIVAYGGSATTGLITVENSYFINTAREIWLSTITRSVISTLLPLENSDFLLDVYQEMTSEKFLDFKICTRLFQNSSVGNIVRVNGAYYLVLRIVGSSQYCYLVKVNYIP